MHGDRVELRPLEAADVDPVAALFEHPVLAEAWPGDNAARLAAQLHEDEGQGFTVNLDGRLIGFIQFYEEPDPDYRHAAIDIAIHPDFCNQGLGTDALRTLVRHLVDDRGHHRITIDPNVANARAIASYRKVGFREVGVMRRYERGNDGQWRDGLLMDLLRDDPLV